MRPHIDAMRNNIASALQIDVSQDSVKATTEEGLGFTGSGEGIAAQAVALIESPLDLSAATAMTSDAAGRSCGNCGGCPMRQG